MAHEPRSFRRLNFSGIVPGTILQIIVVDIVCPYMLYQFLRDRLGTIETLLLVALFPLIHVIARLVGRRGLDVLGIGSLFVLASMMLDSYLPGNSPLSPVLRYTLPIGFLGLLFLSSSLFSMPLFFLVDRFFSAAGREGAANQEGFHTVDSDKDRVPRDTIQTINLIWGVTQLVVALLLLACYFLFPGAPLPMIIPFLATLFYIVLIMWTIQYRGDALERQLPVATVPPEEDSEE